MALRSRTYISSDLTPACPAYSWDRSERLRPTAHMASQFPVMGGGATSAPSKSIGGTTSSTSSVSTHPARTFDGRPFRAPLTRDLLKTLLTPNAIGPAELITLFIIFLQFLSLVWVTRISPLFYVLNFAFWRLSYNVGLGILLRFQSQSQSITRLVDNLQSDARALLHWIVRRAALSTTSSLTIQNGRPSQIDVSSLPNDFIAWLAFRAVATCVLANDGFSFAMVAVVYMSRSLSLSSPLSIIASVVSCVVAIPLAGIAVWAKLRAHQRLRDFGWFWADFFFLLDYSSSSPSDESKPSIETPSTSTASQSTPDASTKGSLVTDGVFAVFPHPMYTAGYLIYFSVAIASRSYVVLAIAAATHILQLLFLFIVEEPHMVKIYASPLESTIPDPKSLHNSLSENDNPALRLFEQGAPHPVTIIATAVSFAVVIFISIIAFIDLMPSSIISTISFPAVVVFSRALFWIFLAYFLGKPPYGENRWDAWLRSMGASHSQIFVAWQHVLLVLIFANHSLFLVLAASSFFASYGRLSFFALFGAPAIAATLCAILFVFFGASSSFLAIRKAGLFSFFYGDFFVHPGQGVALCRNGPFAYVSHPEATLSYLVYYGVACLARSPSTALVAAICQLMHVMFVTLVEEPHMSAVYSDASIAPSPWLKALHSVPHMTPIIQAVSNLYANLMKTFVTQGTRLCSFVIVRSERAQADATKAVLHACTRATRSAETFSFSNLVKSPRSLTWCSDLRAHLQKFGANIPSVPDTSHKPAHTVSI